MTHKFPNSAILTMQSDSQDEVDKSIASMSKQRVDFPDVPAGLRLPLSSDPNAAKILDPNESIKDIDIEMLIQGKREILNAQLGARPIGSRSKEKSTVQYDVAEYTKSIQSDHEHIQMMLDEFWIQVGVTDWHVVFNPPEVTDKMRIAQTKKQNIENAILMKKNMGHDVKLNSEGDDFIWSHEQVHDVSMERDDPQISDKNENFDGVEGESEMPKSSDPGGAGEGTVGSGDYTSPDERKGPAEQ